MGLEKRVEEVAREVVDTIVKAFEVLSSLSPIGESSLLERLRDAVMVIVHELAHEAIGSAYRELSALYEKDPVLEECTDEVGARMLEVFVMKKIGAPAHSFEDLARELECYASLKGACWSADALQELYDRVEPLLERGELRGFVDAIVEECRSALKGGRGEEA